MSTPGHAENFHPETFVPESAVVPLTQQILYWLYIAADNYFKLSDLKSHPLSSLTVLWVTSMGWAPLDRLAWGQSCGCCFGGTEHRHVRGKARGPTQNGVGR